MPKDQIRALPSFEEHSIIKAPLGTVIPINEDDYSKLAPLVDEPPEVETLSYHSDIPPPFAWDQRAKAAYPMPGGYQAYLTSLETLIGAVEEERPTRSEFPELISRTLKLSANNGQHLAVFVRRAGIFIDHGETVDPSSWTRSWTDGKDNRILVALLHARIRFIGEMLDAAIEPITTSDLLDVANNQYACGWSTKAQIDRRRGWLQSAGMLATDESNRLQTTPEGKALLNRLVLHRPTATVSPKQPEENVLAENAPAVSVAAASPVIGDLVAELHAAAVDSANPDRFEQSVRDAFAWLGFDAEWLGGAGRTDVLLDAPLGKGRSFRVIIDCKTSASGSVGDGQVDWITLTEHKKKHDADYVTLVAPQPSGKRLFQRASEQGVVIIPVDELATLCEQHANAPLDLETYRMLFTEGGAVDTGSVAEHAEEWLHVVELARTVIDTVALRSDKFGGLTAEALLLLLADNPAAETADQVEIQSILDTLGGPLIRVLSGDTVEGYWLTTPRPVARHRLKMLARMLVGGTEV